MDDTVKNAAMKETVMRAPKGDMFEAQLKKLKNRYPEAALEQLARIFTAYDPEKDGFINLTMLPRMCSDLGVKPWKALKEICVEDNRISFDSFTRWWFSESVVHSREEEEYVSHIFDQCDTSKTGTLQVEDLVKLCGGLKIKPWKAFQELDIGEGKGVTKKAFLNWWFSKDLGSGEHDSSKKAKKKHDSEEKKSKREALVKKMETLSQQLQEVLKELQEWKDGCEDEGKSGSAGKLPRRKSET